MISFSDEATTDKYYKKLQNTKVKDQAIVVDYVGAKSKRKPVNLEPTAGESTSFFIVYNLLYTPCGNFTGAHKSFPF